MGAERDRTKYKKVRRSKLNHPLETNKKEAKGLELGERSSHRYTMKRGQNLASTSLLHEFLRRSYNLPRSLNRPPPQYKRVRHLVSEDAVS